MRAQQSSKTSPTLIQKPDLSSITSPRWRKRAAKLVELGLEVPSELSAFADSADAWREAATIELAALAGTCGPIPLVSITSAAWALAWSRYWMQRLARDPESASLRDVEAAQRLAAAARLDSFAAYELAIRIARANQGYVAPDPLEQVRVDGQHVVPAEPDPPPGTDDGGGGG